MADVKRKISTLDKRTTASETSDYLVIDNGTETSIITMGNLLKDFAHTTNLEEEATTREEADNKLEEKIDISLYVDSEGYICLKESKE